MNRGVGEIRDYLLGQLNNALRRPGMYGGEPALRQYLDTLAFVERRERALADELAALRQRGAFNSAGVNGAVRQLLGERAEDVMASVYVEVARRIGWLVLDEPTTKQGYGAVREQLADWCQEDHGYDETLARFGEPGVLLGGTNPKYPKTIGYATVDDRLPPLFFHFWNGTAPGTEPTWPPEHPEPLLLAAREGGSAFPDGFLTTPLGRSRRASLTA